MTLIPRQCTFCGKSFGARPDAVRAGGGRFCSMRCVYDSDKFEPLQQRFDRSVKKTDTCWLWHGGRLNSGYGEITRNGKRERAHRVSWEMHVGPIPHGLHVLHKCDVRACVNPDHLFIGTRSDNMQDAAKKHRLAQQTDPDRNIRAGLTRAKLSVDQVVAIRQAHANGDGLSALGRRYGVTKHAIYRIVNVLAWKHVDLIRQHRQQDTP